MVGTSAVLNEIGTHAYHLAMYSLFKEKDIHLLITTVVVWLFK